MLQQAGYKTGFFGKWHMGGDSDLPQRGFDRWVSFRGQGKYWPDNRGGESKGGQSALLNVDGRELPQRGYITDELTDYALDWMKTVPKDRPFFLYLSHKAVHGRVRFRPSATPAATRTGPCRCRPRATHHEHAPMWVQNQRNSWHGIEFAYYVDRDFDGLLPPLLRDAARGR